MNVTLKDLGVDQLSIADRLELISLLWDSIPETGFAAPEWHLRELDRRRAAAEAEPDAGVPWEVVKTRLSGQS